MTFNRLAAGAALLFLGSCTSSTPQANTSPTRKAEPSPSVEHAPQTDAPDEASTTPAPEAPPKTLQVGEVTDGVSLTEADVAELGYMNSPMELQISGAVLTLSFDGSGPPPHTSARLSDDGRRVLVTVAGVRGVTAQVPLTSGEGGRRLAEPKTIDLGPVVSIARTFHPDDSAIQLEVALSAPVQLDLRLGETGRSVQVLMHNRP